MLLLSSLFLYIYIYIYIYAKYTYFPYILTLSGCQGMHTFRNNTNIIKETKKKGEEGGE